MKCVHPSFKFPILQLTPHSDQFHLCDAAGDGSPPRKVLGFLMEQIQGCRLEDLAEEIDTVWSETEKRSLVSAKSPAWSSR